MINNKLLLTAGAVALSVGFYSTTATAATETGNASATVLTPISIVNGTNAMFFGILAGDADVNTTVVLTAGGVATSADGANVSGTPTAGDFDVSGSGTLAYDISLPADGVVTLAGPDTAMPVNSFADSTGGTSNLSGGNDSFSVGATLTINAGQAAGAYSGTYDVTVNYQ